MKLIITPHGKTFTAAELCADLTRWLPPGVDAEITAVCTFGGSIKRVELDLTEPDETRGP
ncbi:hypothetical protein ACWEVP_31885 [Amycolatopsis sp. NPDC003865]